MAINFRMFGGQTSSYGGQVDNDRLYRGGAPIDPAVLAAHDFALVGDLRHPLESAVPWPSPWNERRIGEDASTETAPPHFGLMDGQTIDSAKVREYYVDLYRSMPLEDRYQSLFSRTIRALSALSGDQTALVCCSAGKDRTGILIVLIGEVLGVRREELLQDYLLSGVDTSLKSMIPLVRQNARKASGQELSEALCGEVLGVSPEYLAATYGTLDTNFGGVIGYLEAIGVTAHEQQALRDNWLR